MLRSGRHALPLMMGTTTLPAWLSSPARPGARSGLPCMHEAQINARGHNVERVVLQLS